VGNGSAIARREREDGQRAGRQGGQAHQKAKTGYTLQDGVLVRNEDADRVGEVFRLWAEGVSQREIEARTSIKYSTVSSILRSRVYLGELPQNGQWFPATMNRL
jgi:DNA invertase Pin-like site-specific DNA recombinase